MNEQIEFEMLTGLTFDDTNKQHKLCVDLMAQENKVRAGNEGLVSVSANGMSETYKDGYSKRVMDIINKLKKRVKIL